MASYDTSSSRKALKALIKKETKKEKDSTAARLERLETSALEIEQAVEQQTELLLTRHAFEDYKRTFECYMKQIQPGLQRPPSPAVVGRRLSEAPVHNGQPPPRACKGPHKLDFWRSRLGVNGCSHFVDRYRWPLRVSAVIPRCVAHLSSPITAARAELDF